MLLDVANVIIKTYLLVYRYGAITNILKTGPGLTHIPHSLTHIHFNMDDVIMEVQGCPEY